jgi:hypothetical protein
MGQREIYLVIEKNSFEGLFCCLLGMETYLLTKDTLVLLPKLSKPQIAKRMRQPFIWRSR